MMISRLEKVTIKISMTKSEFDKCREDFLIVNPSPFFNPDYIVEGDEVRLTYSFDIEYIGEIEKKLEAMTRIVEHVDIKSLDIKEITRSEILLEKMLVSMRKIQKKIAGKNVS